MKTATIKQVVPGNPSSKGLPTAPSLANLHSAKDIEVTVKKDIPTENKASAGKAPETPPTKPRKGPLALDFTDRN